MPIQAAKVFPSLRKLGTSPQHLLNNQDSVREVLYHLGIGQRIDQAVCHEQNDDPRARWRSSKFI